MASASKQNLAGMILAWIGRTIAVVFQHVRFQIWALWAIGPVFILIYGAQLAAILSTHWPVGLRGEQLRYLGVASWISLGIIAVSVVLMANVIRKANIKIGAAEIEVETVTNTSISNKSEPKEEDDGRNDDPR
jgi:hypothetical protein